jgi:hypothetical protein
MVVEVLELLLVVKRQVALLQLARLVPLVEATIKSHRLLPTK